VGDGRELPVREGRGFALGLQARSAPMAASCPWRTSLRRTSGSGAFVIGTETMFVSSR
jgi:hypothetical protein